MLVKYPHTPSQTVVRLRSQERGLFEQLLPPAELLSQENKLRLRQRLRENVRSLLSGADWLDVQGSIRHKAPKMMVFQRNVLGARGELGTFSHSDAAAVVFLNCAKEARLLLRELLWKKR